MKPATRCDMHPNPACVYVNDDGERVAEDEEGCLEEYKKKGLVAKSATFQCESPFHNRESPAVTSPVFDETRILNRRKSTALNRSWAHN